MKENFLNRVITMAKAALLIGVALLTIMTICGGACTQQPMPTQTPPVIYSILELKYLLLSNFENVFYVDPDFYPITRAGHNPKRPY